MDYKVAVRGHKEKFPDTKSVIEDEATNVAGRLRDVERHKKRRADEKRNQGTKSVLADEAKNVATKLKESERYNKRKADEMSTDEDEKLKNTQPVALPAAS